MKKGGNTGWFVLSKYILLAQNDLTASSMAAPHAINPISYSWII